jgi:hypothetical protein
MAATAQMPLGQETIRTPTWLLAYELGVRTRRLSFTPRRWLAVDNYD